MMALLYLLVFGFYFAIVFVLARAGFRFLRRHGKGRLPAVTFAVAIAFSGFAAIFWDAIPTWYTHHHLCETEGGLKVYMTPEQWAKENPEAFTQVRAAAGREQTSRIEVTPQLRRSRVESTEGFVYEYLDQRGRNYAFHTGIETERLIFKPTGQILFEKTDFNSAAGNNSLAVGANSLADYKFWTVTGGCESAYPEMKQKFTYEGHGFGYFLGQIEGWNRK